MKEYLKLKFSNFPTKFQNLKLVKINYYNRLFSFKVYFLHKILFSFSEAKLKLTQKLFKSTRKTCFYKKIVREGERELSGEGASWIQLFFTVLSLYFTQNFGINFLNLKIAQKIFESK